MSNNRNIDLVGKNQDNKYAVDTKIDWCSFVFHIGDEDPERALSRQQSLLKAIIETLELDITDTKGNLLRDVERSIAIVRVKRSLRIEYEGSFFQLGRNNFAILKKELTKLNSLISDDESWSLSRLDIAKTVSDITVEQLVPDPKEFFYDFKFKRVNYWHSSGVLETTEIRCSHTSMVFYRKDLQFATLSKELQDKKVTEKHYREKPHTRAEVRFKSGSDTLKIALELLLKNEMNEIDFCNDLLKDGTKKRNVKVINPKDKNRSRWEIEERWASLFKTSDNRLRVNPEIIKLITSPVPPDIKNREIKRFKKFLERNDFSYEEAMEMLQGTFGAKSSSEAQKGP